MELCNHKARVIANQKSVADPQYDAQLAEFNSVCDHLLQRYLALDSDQRKSFCILSPESEPEAVKAFGQADKIWQVLNNRPQEITQARRSQRKGFRRSLSEAWARKRKFMEPWRRTE
jgi:hypothetical protein